MQRIEASALVLVEGKDDECIIRCLIQAEGLSDIEVVKLGGKDDWGKKIRSIVRAPGFGKVKSILLVRDNDDNPAATAESVKGALRINSLPVPAQAGAWAGSTPGVKAAFHVLPAEVELGELEDLCMGVAQGTPAHSCVIAAEVAARELPNPPRKWAKFRVQVYLAAQPEVFDTLDLGARAGVFPAAHPAFAPLRAILREM